MSKNQPQKPKIVGLVGGVASGKSEVSRRFEMLGGVVIRADEIGHEVINSAEVQEILRDRWGEQIVGENGETNRAEIAKIVFADSITARQEKEFLDSVTHPRIRRVSTGLLEGYLHQSTPPPIIILDAALMIESGWAEVCDHIIFVDTPEWMRDHFALARGWEPEERAKRELSQLSLAEKRQKSDIVIDNSGTLVDLHDQVDRIFREFTECK